MKSTMAGRDDAEVPLTALLPVEMVPGQLIIRDIVKETDTCLVSCEMGEDPNGALERPLQLKGMHGE